MSADAFDDHNFVDAPTTAPKPCDCHHCEGLRPIVDAVARIEALLTPKPKAKPQKQDPDVVAALTALATRTGVPIKPCDRVELRSAMGLHGRAPMLKALEDEPIAKAVAAFVNRNTIQAAAAHFARRGTTERKVTTWRPEPDE